MIAPPIEAEQGILSAIMNGAPIEDIDLAPGDFYRTAHQVVFSAMLQMERNRQPVELVGLVDHLRNSGHLEKTGGASGVAALMDHPVAVSVSHAAEIIRAASLRRQLADTCARVADKARGEGGNVAELLDDAQRRIMAIGADRVTAAPETMAAACDGLIEDIEAIQTGRRCLGLQTGFTKLDETLGGMQPGDLIILAARPSMGKTALALNIAENTAHDGNRVAFFSLEQPKKQLALRSLARATGISISALRSGNLSASAWTRIVEAQGNIQGIPLLIDDRAGLHVREIQRACRRFAKDGGLSLLVVDYIQLCHGGQAQRKDLEIGAISAGLKTLAKDLGVPVLALSQLSRETERRQDRRPQLSDLRESGALEQDADVVVLLFNENRYTKKVPEHQQAVAVEVRVEKNRQGPTGFFQLQWRAWLTTFDNL
jgi:replicative DNA helicase